MPDPQATLTQAHILGFFNHVFAYGWNTTKEPHVPVQKKSRMEATSIRVGVWKDDLPMTGKSRHPTRLRGQPAYLSVAAVPLVNTLEYKAKDARGVFASIEHIQWSDGPGGLSEEQAFQLCTRADGALVTAVDSWNTQVGVYKARKILRTMAGQVDNNSTPGAHRAQLRAEFETPLSGSPSSMKRKRLEAEESNSYLGYEGRVLPVLVRQRNIGNLVFQNLDNGSVTSNDMDFSLLG
jgi:hypothetical protein